MPAPASFDTDLAELRSWFGIGVAGNFAGHLEQAGEAGDFAGVTAAADAPKGLFPFYAPGHDSFLAEFPLSHDKIEQPADPERATKLQVEPEVALACSVTYDADGSVAELQPFAFGAFNDCSIRIAGAAKISEKKHWGPCSKGIAPRFFALGDTDLVAATSGWRLASFLRRDGELHAYGIDSPLSGYSYYGARLLDWIVERLANQSGGDDTPLEPVGEYLAACGRPSELLVAIGATRYTDFGESTHLRPGDESLVVVYDAHEHDPASIGDTFASTDPLAAIPAASVLAQTVA